jgi:hypothetical protein
MNNKSLLKGTVLPVAVMCSAMTFNPVFGVISVHADTQVVQQQAGIRGNVVDDHGDPVIGATVMIVGGNASQGAITDLDGNFTVSVEAGAKLKIS